MTGRAGNCKHDIPRFHAMFREHSVALDSMRVSVDPLARLCVLPAYKAPPAEGANQKLHQPCQVGE